VLLRPATSADAGFLREMLAETIGWDRPPGEDPPALEEILGIPQVADYVQDWGRAGDHGVVAEEDGRPVGACWLRRFTEAHPGYGFLGEDVPGIGLAVVPEYRGRGIGKALLRAAIELAGADGVSTLSLSVETGNERARRLYERAGFVAVGREGGSWTMRLDLG
jgi:ribosomal protein S18 acetylase RimI-like enzyme